MKREPLTSVSTAGYSKILPGLTGISLLEMFYNIGIDLIELYNEDLYIHLLVDAMQAKTPFANIDEANLKLRQINSFYNESIALYEELTKVDPDKDSKSRDEIEKVIYKMLSYQSPEENRRILLGVAVEAIDTMAIEYDFMDMMEDLDDYALLIDYLNETVFRDLETCVTVFETLLTCEVTLADEKKKINSDDIFSMAMLIYISLASLNDIRKLRIEVEESIKVGRNDPCPCGSGKKYKKCCGR